MKKETRAQIALRAIAFPVRRSNGKTRVMTWFGVS